MVIKELVEKTFSEQGTSEDERNRVLTTLVNRYESKASIPSVRYPSSAKIQKRM